MASLYIDRLKSNFQRTEPCIRRTDPRKLWYPEIFTEILGNRNSNDSFAHEAFRVKNAVMNFLPKVPKIFTIGLRFDCDYSEDTSVSQYWNIGGVKTFFTHYFGLVRSMSWKSVPKETTHHYCFSLISIDLIIPKCSKKLIGKCLKERNADCSMVLKESTEKEAESYDTIVNSEIHNGQSNYTTAEPIDILTEQYNSYTSNDNQTRKSKRNACVQPPKRKPKRYKQKDQNENADIETIFTTDRENFYTEMSNTNLELLEILARRRKKGRDETRTNISTNTKENVSYRKNSIEEGTTNNRVKFDKNRKTGAIKDSWKYCILEYNNTVNSTSDNVKDQSLTLSSHQSENSDVRRVLGRKIENDTDTINTKKCVKNNGEIIVENSVLIESNASWISPNYVLENKSSELMILGNVKKRLEEDYDDYFSLDDIDLEKDLFDDTNDPDSIIQINQPASEIKMNIKKSSNKLRKARSMLMTTSVKEHHGIKQELTNESIRTSLTCASSVEISNSDLSRPESSYHTTLREQKCSPSSSIEYCTASNLSLTNLQFSRSNSFNALFQSCSLNTDPTYDHKLRRSEKQEYFSNDTSFQHTSEFLDQTQINSYTVCCCQRNSTPKLSSTLKVVAESLDSGILTDYSHDHFRTMSNERFREKSSRKDGGQKKCSVREMDFLPTYDFNTDSSYSDDSLNRRVDMAVKKFTENLILGERKARRKLRRTENPARHKQERKRRKKCRQVKNASDCHSKRSSTCIFECSPRFYDDDWLISSTTPPLFSFSDSEMDHL